MCTILDTLQKTRKGLEIEFKVIINFYTYINRPKSKKKSETWVSLNLILKGENFSDNQIQTNESVSCFKISTGLADNWDLECATI